MDMDLIDIVEDTIRKTKRIEAMGVAIARFGEGEDKDQVLEWHGEAFGEIVVDIAKEIQEDLNKLEGMMRDEKPSKPINRFCGTIEAANG